MVTLSKRAARANRLGLPLYAVILSLNPPFGRSRVVAITTHPDRLIDQLSDKPYRWITEANCDLDDDKWSAAQACLERGEPLYALVRTKASGSRPIIDLFMSEEACRQIAAVETSGHKSFVIPVDSAVTA
jgi:hypothetical protein